MGRDMFVRGCSRLLLIFHLCLMGVGRLFGALDFREDRHCGLDVDWLCLQEV